MCLAERLQWAAWVSVILSQLLPQFLIFGVLYPTPQAHTAVCHLPDTL